MILLLDTHALIWWLADDAALPVQVRKTVENAANTVLVSAASAFEVSTKYRIGKLPGAAALAMTFEATITKEGFRPLPIAMAHASLAGNLKISHRDPFDRILIAQALFEQIVLVSNETLFDGFGVNRLW